MFACRDYFPDLLSQSKVVCYYFPKAKWFVFFVYKSYQVIFSIYIIFSQVIFSTHIIFSINFSLPIFIIFVVYNKTMKFLASNSAIIRCATALFLMIFMLFPVSLCCDSCLHKSKLVYHSQPPSPELINGMFVIDYLTTFRLSFRFENRCNISIHMT